MEKKIYILILFISLSFDLISKPDSKIALLIPSELQNQKTNINQTIIDDITFWEIFLIEHKINYTVIFQNELSSNLASEFSIIIIPTDISFTQKQSEQIKFAINQGLGILSNGKLSIKENENTSDFCENVFNVQVKLIDSLDKTVVQYFTTQNRILVDEEFDLLVGTESDKKLYEVTDFRISPFGKIGAYGNLTKAFYGFIGEGRFAHFDFTVNQILSGTDGINKFKKLILKTISWLDKDAGIWINNSDEIQFFVILDQTTGIPVKQEVLKYLEVKHIPVLLISNDKATQNLNHLNIIGYAYNASSIELNPDTLINLLLSTKTEEKFIILNENQFSNDNLRKLSFIGVENVFILNSAKIQFNEISNQLVYPITDLNYSSSISHNLKYLYYPPRVDCKTDTQRDFLNQLESAQQNCFPFNREKIINNILTNQLNINSRLSDNSLIISLSNASNREVKDVKLIIDKKTLKKAIVYEVLVDQKLLSIQKNKITNYFKIELPEIKPRNNVEIKLLFDKNL